MVCGLGEETLSLRNSGLLAQMRLLQTDNVGLLMRPKANHGLNGGWVIKPVHIVSENAEPRRKSAWGRGGRRWGSHDGREVGSGEVSLLTWRE